MCVSVAAVKQVYLDKQVMPHFMINENDDSYVYHMSYVLPVYRHSSLQYIYNTISTVWLKTFWLEIPTLLFFLFMFSCKINSSQIQCVYKGMIRLYQFDICRASNFPEIAEEEASLYACVVNKHFCCCMPLAFPLCCTYLTSGTIVSVYFLKMDINYVVQTILIDIASVWYIHSDKKVKFVQ